ncbi:FAD:protein FMN transferase [Pseudolysinimonas kribbensis]|uniref:FAD:protein FMN transferase n=1 Tax=Pseudolysinimonas kribbensis TaxID=433641 RepID=A0ABQ6K421_9MICO|nr:FAD:protein FMN transferase [Pseudolysinimonas kribbensis]GMA95368.1 FAD:protein FMN transferase [Pseudolysinimonas kribbensis]
MTAWHVFSTMGTVVSIHADAPIARHVLREVEGVFAAFDRRFSLYRPDSEISRIADGRLALLAAGAELRNVYELALGWRSATHGAFTPHRPDGVVDLSGVVKALAIRDAGTALDHAGATTWSIGCGGDILTRLSDGAEQTIGIADPADRRRLLTAVAISAPHRAIATSGVSERGEHVWGPRPDFDQVTVLAADIVTADVLATAILAGGQETCDEVTATMPVDVLCVRRDGEVVGTPGARLALPA